MGHSTDDQRDYAFLNWINRMTLAEGMLGAIVGSGDTRIAEQRRRNVGDESV